MGFKMIDQTKGIWKKTPYTSLLYLLLIVILACLISSYLFGAVACKLIYGISFFSSSQQVFDPSNKQLIEAMKTMQLFNALGTFVLPPFLFLHFRGSAALTYLKLDKSISKTSVFRVFIMALFMIPIANYLGALNESIPLPEFLNFLKIAEEQTLLLTEQFLIMNSLSDLFLMIIIMGVVAAVGEELLFRGLLQRLFQDWSGNKHLAVWLTALLFSVIHMQYHAVLPRFFLGAFIGYVFVYSGSLRTSIYLHFFYNTSLVLLTYCIQHKMVPSSWESIGTSNFSMFILSLVLIYGFSYSWFTKNKAA